MLNISFDISENISINTTKKRIMPGQLSDIILISNCVYVFIEPGC